MSSEIRRCLQTAFCSTRRHRIIGVEFVQSDLIEFGNYGRVSIKLLYDGVGYFKLAKNVRFYVGEGGYSIVGEGYVLE